MNTDFHCDGTGIGTLVKSELRFYKRGAAPIRLAHISFPGFEMKFLVRYLEVWNRLEFALAENHFEGFNITCAITYQLYVGKSGKINSSLSLFDFQKGAITSDFGIRVEFCGRIIDTGVGDSKEYDKIDISSQNGFRCFALLYMTELLDPMPGTIVKGAGQLKTGAIFGIGKGSSSLPYVEVNHISDVSGPEDNASLKGPNCDGFGLS